MYAFRSLTTSATQLPHTKHSEAGVVNYSNDFLFFRGTPYNVVASYFAGGIFPYYPILSSFLTVATREHYTVDVVLAWIIFGSLILQV